MQLFVKLPERTVVLNDLSAISSVFDVKQKVFDECGALPAIQSLQCNGKILKDSCTLKDSRIGAGSLLTVTFPIRGGAKKGKSKVGKKKKQEEEAPPADEFDAMNIDELRRAQQVLQEKHDAVLQQRSFFQLERDQLQKFFDIVNHDTNNTELHIKNLEAEIELIQNSHRNSIRMYVQKVKHLEYDHKNTANAVSMEMAMMQDEENKIFADRNTRLGEQKRILEKELAKQQLANEEEIKQLQQSETKEMAKLKQEFEARFQQLRQGHEKKLSDLTRELELQKRLESHEIEERKNLHINDLIDNHESAFNRMRDYYNAITQDNLDLIRALKEELVELQHRISAHEIRQEEILSENKKLSVPLHDAQDRVLDLRKKLANHEKDRRSLKAAKVRMGMLIEKLEALQQEHNTTRTRFQVVHNTKENLHGSFEQTVNGLQDQLGHVTDSLESYLQNIEGDFHQEAGNFDALLSQANVDPVVVKHLKEKLNSLISEKNLQIKANKYKLAKAAKAHDDLVRVYESKLVKLGIPPSELGLQCIHVDGSTLPASLAIS